MTVENFASALRVFIERKPFQVFTIELHGGQRLEVDHPGAIFSSEGVAFFFAPGSTPILFDHESVNKVFGATANIEF